MLNRAHRQLIEQRISERLSSIGCCPRVDKLRDIGEVGQIRRLLCVHYDKALTLAATGEWEGFACPPDCAAYQRIDADTNRERGK